MTPDLSLFDNSWYNPGRGRIVQALWFFLGLPLLRSHFIPWSSLRVRVLRVFGASIAENVVIKPGVRVKYPWLLSIGRNSWIGESAWIDNLARVTIGHDVCVSQGAYLCTGNHDWRDPAFGLMVDIITLEPGSWVGTHAIVCPGVVIGEAAVALAGAVVTRHIPAFEIHSGNPARFLRPRTIRHALPADQPVLPA